MDAHQENELFQTLGRIEAKVEGMCKKNVERHIEVTKLHDKLADVIDNSANQYKFCQRDIKSKVGWKLLIPAAGLFVSLLFGAYKYTYDVSNDLSDHNTNIKIHKTGR